MTDTESKQNDDRLESPKIAVLGGSGFIGSYLVMNLMQMGCRLRLLSHRTNPDYISLRGQIETVPGSIEDEQSMIGCFDGCHMVIHLVGIIAETKTKTFRNTIAEGTAKLVRAAKKAGVQKALYLSALGAAADAPSLYFRTKWEAEQHVIGSGLTYTIFRPSIVYGIQDKFINMIAQMIRMTPIVPVLGDGLYKLQPVYVEELCAVMAASTRKPVTDNKIYDIGGPEQLTYMEILDIIKRVLKRKRATIHIPLFLGKMAAAVMEKMIKPAPLTRDQISMMEAGSTCDTTHVEKDFGVTFSPLESQLQKYLRN